MIDRILLRAAELISTRGLWKRKPFGPTGELCALAAINAATQELAGCDNMPAFINQMELTHVWLRSVLPDVTHIHLWNDAETTTAVEVAYAMRSAAFNYSTE